MFILSAVALNYWIRFRYPQYLHRLEGTPFRQARREGTSPRRECHRERTELPQLPGRLPAGSSDIWVS